MTIRLDQGLVDLASGSDDAVFGATAASIRARAGRARRRRTTWGLVVLVLVVVLGAAGAAVVQWWQQRPIPNSFGEAEPTVVWQFPAAPTAEQVRKRCPKANHEAQVPSWGQELPTSDEGLCNLGYERPAQPSSPGLKLPLASGDVRTTCERVTGKDLAGWQFVARSRVTVDGSADSFDWEMNLFRSANDHWLRCDLYHQARTPGVRGTIEIDTGDVQVSSTTGIWDDRAKEVVMTSAFGPVRDASKTLDHRAARLHIDLGAGVPACDIAVTNGYASGRCISHLDKPIRPEDATDWNRPIVVHVLDRHGRELHHFDALMT